MPYDLMKENFHITGLFYEIDGLKCRKFLNIKKKLSKLNSPDLMVIMMNPGKSKPVDGVDNGNKETETIPDKTQSQIMRVMNNCGFNFARILNLSDVRKTPAKEFYKMLPKLKANKIPHSIFDSDRNEDFNHLFVRNIPTIYAWGVDDCLTDLAQVVIDKIKIEHPIGLRKAETKLAFYHPLPRNTYQQKEWVKKIVAQIKKRDKNSYDGYKLY